MNIFLHFPTEFDEQKFVINFVQFVVNKIKSKKGCKFYYHKKNVQDFLKDNEEANVYLTGEANALRILLGKTNTYEITEGDFEGGTMYLIWDFNEFKVFPCGYNLAYLSQKLFENLNYPYTFINFDKSLATDKGEVIVFKDSKLKDDYPKGFLFIDLTESNSEFLFSMESFPEQEFSLRDKEKFRKRPEIMKGAVVYYDFKNDKYWHRDTFHDYIEYEVYDGNGDHYATANENGEIDLKKKDPEKKNILGK